MPTIAVNGIDLYFEVFGSGPRLFYCNGSGTSIETTRPLIDVWAGSFEVAVNDQRGLGRTVTPDEPYTMAQYAADAAALMDHLGWETTRLVGVSFGGMVAQEIAVTWPERIERLALLCTSPGGEGGSSFPLHELEALPEDERVTKGLSILDSRFSQPGWFDDHPDDLAILTGQAERRSAQTPEQARGAQKQLEARRHHDVCDRLHRIDCPTFVASGHYDGIAPVKNGQAIVDRIGDNAELHTYEGGHLFFVQDRTAFPEILSFLAG